MKNSTLQFLLAFFALAFAGAFEELSPKFLGVGLPFLLVSVQFAASACGGIWAVLFAVAAGAMEDALSSLPIMTSVSYFLVMVLIARRIEMPIAMTVVTWPLYQVWLALWMRGMGGGVFARTLLAVPIGLVTAVLFIGLLRFLRRKAALDEES